MKEEPVPEVCHTQRASVPVNLGTFTTLNR